MSPDVIPESKWQNEVNSRVLDGAGPRKRSPLLFQSSVVTVHTRIRAHPEDRVTEVREAEERNRDTSRSSRQTHPKRAGLSGFSCSALRTHDDHTFALRVSCAPGRSGERGSSRLVLTQEDSATWRVHTARRWSSVFARKAAANVRLAAWTPFETRSFPRVSSRARCASCTVWRNECHSSRGNFDEMHYNVMNSRCEYTRVVA